MNVKTLDKPIQETGEDHAKDVCIHHWLIDPPDSPVSMGVCLKCGLQREFKNYTAYSPWDSISESLKQIDLGVEVNTNINEDWD